MNQSNGDEEFCLDNLDRLLCQLFGDFQI